MKKEATIIKNGYDYEVLFNYDSIRRIVRHPEYQKLCDGLIFDEDGFAVTDLLTLYSIQPEKGELRYEERKRSEEKQKKRIDIQRKNIEEIRREFGLEIPIKPQVVLEKTYSPDFYFNLPLFKRNPFAVSMVFRKSGVDTEGFITFTPIYNGHFLRLNIDSLGHFKKQVVSGIKEYISRYKKEVKEGEAEVIPCKVLRKEDRSLVVEIDLLAEERDIFRVIRKHINPSTKRYHLKKRDQYYEIWDLRVRENLSFRKIALRFTKEGNRISSDTVRKRFHQAYYLIIGEDPKWDFLRMLNRSSGGKSSSIRTTGLSAEAEKRAKGSPEEAVLIEESLLKDGTAEDQFKEIELYKDVYDQCGCKSCPNQECRESIRSHREMINRACPRLRKWGSELRS